MKFATITLFILITLLVSNGVHASNDTPVLHVSIPGEALQVDIPDSPHSLPLRLKKPWYSISLDSSGLVLDRTVTTRRPDWNLITSSTGSQTSASKLSTKSRQSARHALALSNSAILAFRLDHADDKFASFKTGKYPSSLPLPAILHDRWKSAFEFNGKNWTVSTEVVRRKDGAMLAGSLQLVATNGAGERLVLVPPAHGMAFERQELLWLGSLGPNSGFDLLLKRTWVTGEIDYVLRIGDSLGFAKLDQDYPHSYFSQGVEEYENTETHVSQKRPQPQGKFGLAALSIPEATWNEAVAKANAEGRPTIMFDQQLILKSERMRVSIEYLPRIERGESESATSSAQSFWDGPVLVKVHFRNKSQILMQTGGLDGGPFRLQLDMLNGEPAIEVSVSPHYNNNFIHYWIWGGTENRFLRLSKAQFQGC